MLWGSIFYSGGPQGVKLDYFDKSALKNNIDTPTNHTSLFCFFYASDSFFPFVGVMEKSINLNVV